MTRSRIARHPIGRRRPRIEGAGDVVLHLRLVETPQIPKDRNRPFVLPVHPQIDQRPDLFMDDKKAGGLDGPHFATGGKTGLQAAQQALGQMQ
jgi:hypothetical protein